MFSYEVGIRSITHPFALPTAYLRDGGVLDSSNFVAKNPLRDAGTSGMKDTRYAPRIYFSGSLVRDMNERQNSVN